jgi:deoxycytidylate deaminase
MLPISRLILIEMLFLIMYNTLMKNSNVELIIGLTGSFGAGCTTTSLFLKEEKNFVSFSLSDALKEKAKREIKNFQKIENKEKRRILQDLGDNLRKKNAAILTIPIIKEIDKRRLKRVVIDSIRNTAEIEAFKDRFGDKFFLLAIDAEADIRWQRLERLYKKDREGFDINDKRDSGEDQPKHGQQVKRCIELADILVNNEGRLYRISKDNKIIKNNKEIDRYGQKLSDLIDLIKRPGSKKPNLDELYMHYACSLALKSNCLVRQVGAIIVKEEGLNFNRFQEINASNKKIIPIESYIIASGCNNVPIGDIDCFEQYNKECYRNTVKEKYFNKYKFCRKCGNKLNDNLVCSKCNLDNKGIPGKLLDVCRAVHAEQAAILQAAKLGSTPLDGTKLYSTTFPCMLCCKEIINSGIKSVIYLESYPMEGSLAISMFRKANIDIRKFEGVNSIAFNRLFRQYK